MLHQTSPQVGSSLRGEVLPRLLDSVMTRCQDSLKVILLSIAHRKRSAKTEANHNMHLTKDYPLHEPLSSSPASPSYKSLSQMIEDDNDWETLVRSLASVASNLRTIQSELGQAQSVISSEKESERIRHMWKDTTDHVIEEVHTHQALELFSKSIESMESQGEIQNLINRQKHNDEDVLRCKLSLSSVTEDLSSMTLEQLQKVERQVIIDNIRRRSTSVSPTKKFNLVLSNSTEVDGDRARMEDALMYQMQKLRTENGELKQELSIKSNELVQLTAQVYELEKIKIEGQAASELLTSLMSGPRGDVQVMLTVLTNTQRQLLEEQKQRRDLEAEYLKYSTSFSKEKSEWNEKIDEVRRKLEVSERIRVGLECEVSSLRERLNGKTLFHTNIGFHSLHSPSPSS